MNFIRQGLGIALQPELTLKSIAGELCPFLTNQPSIDRFRCWLKKSRCIDSREVRKKPGRHWIIRDLTGLDLVGLASL